jgi:hypothetical protein
MSVYVVPAPAWTKKGLKHLDSRLCGSDEISPTETCPESALERARMLLRIGEGTNVAQRWSGELSFGGGDKMWLSSSRLTHRALICLPLSSRLGVSHLKANPPRNPKSSPHTRGGALCISISS